MILGSNVKQLPAVFPISRSPLRAPPKSNNASMPFVLPSESQTCVRKGNELVEAIYENFYFHSDTHANTKKCGDGDENACPQRTNAMTHASN